MAIFSVIFAGNIGKDNLCPLGRLNWQNAGLEVELLGAHPCSSQGKPAWEGVSTEGSRV
jgi:hypothetical protein